MQGRIVGDDGVYDPANNLFHGMNRSSKLGNLEKAGQKRIDNINKTLARQAKKGKQSQTLIERRDKFERELTEYRNEKNTHNIKSAQKKGIDTTKLNPNEMRNVAESGDPGGSGGGKTKIVCTMMNESYGFGSFRNKIWMKFHGNIAPEYQKGYHKLFLPLVNYAKQKGITNKIIKNILEHIAVHSTIDMRQTLRGKKHTLGRLYRKIILPLCYWAGKK
jgi:flagellar hook-associated protein FlgK